MNHRQQPGIQIPPFWHSILGRRSSMADIAAIGTGAVASGVIALTYSLNAGFATLHTIAFTLLAMDLGGGVIANFTMGTNNYYGESPKRCYQFILFHVLQPLILIWIFPSECWSIVWVCAFVLVCTSIIVRLRELYFQASVAAMLLTISFILLSWLKLADSLLQLMLTFYAIKLILAFGVNWQYKISPDRY
jgi:hypothetical protein